MLKTSIIKLNLALALICISEIGFGQSSCRITVHTDQDTLLLTETLQVTFRIEDQNGRFEAPGFENFRIVMGPNVSSRMSIINGVVEQEQSYSYFLKPMTKGPLSISGARLDLGDQKCISEPLSIFVIDKQGIDQRDQQFSNTEIGDKELIGDSISMNRVPQDSLSKLREALKNLKKKKI